VRRAFLTGGLGTFAAASIGGAALAQSSRLTFPQWVLVV
jgi:hypothetical protein